MLNIKRVRSMLMVMGWVVVIISGGGMRVEGREKKPCVQLYRIEDQMARREEICCDPQDHTCRPPVSDQCQPAVEVKEFPGIVSRSPERRYRGMPKPSENEQQTICESQPVILESRVARFTWIDYEAEGRHGYRGVRWSLRVESPYKVVQDIYRGYRAMIGTACPRHRNAVSVFEHGQPIGCCIPSLVKVRRLQPLGVSGKNLKISIKLDGRFVLDNNDVSIETIRSSFSSPVDDTYCLPDVTPRWLMGTPEVIQIKGVNAIPDRPEARQPAYLDKSHVRQCEKETRGLGVPHFLEIVLQFSEGYSEKVHIPFCVVDYGLLKKKDP